MIERSFVDGQPRTADFRHEIQHLRPAQFHVEGIDFAARGHDFGDIDISQFHHPFDHFAGIGLQQPVTESRR